MVFTKETAAKFGSKGGKNVPKEKRTYSKPGAASKAAKARWDAYEKEKLKK